MNLFVKKFSAGLPYQFLGLCLKIMMWHLQSNLHVSVLASLAGAVVWMGELPTKLNPIIHPVMAAVKREQVKLLVL